MKQRDSSLENHKKNYKAETMLKTKRLQKKRQNTIIKKNLDKNRYQRKTLKKHRYQRKTTMNIDTKEKT